MWARTGNLRLLALAVAAASVTWCTALTPAAAATATQFRIKGRGWGHGIGLSQYGSQGFAQRGYTASQIISYYYTGTSLGQRPDDAASVDVQLVSGRAAASFVGDSADVEVHHGGTTKALQLGDVVIARIEGANVGIYRLRGSDELQLFGGDAIVTSITGSSIKTRFTAENGFYGRHYRGSIRIHRVGSALSVINRVGLEPYLYGVVPAEMPPSWHAEALKAQAIAARSYAVATRASGLYDMHSDTRSQMYGGKEEEEASTTTAIDATAGKVAIYAGTTIQAFFSSTSGGRTADNEDVWPAGTPLAYLRSKPDPYETSPYSRWPITAYTPRGLARRFSYGGKVSKVGVSINNSRRAASVAITHGATTSTLSGGSFQYRMGLRSTWFRVEKLSIMASDYTVNAGARVVLSGTIPGNGTTSLWYHNRSGGAWVKVRDLSPGTGGAWRRTVTPPVDRTFRLKRDGKLGPGVLIDVS